MLIDNEFNNDYNKITTDKRYSLQIILMADPFLSLGLNAMLPFCTATVSTVDQNKQSTLKRTLSDLIVGSLSY